MSVWSSCVCSSDLAALAQFQRSRDLCSGRRLLRQLPADRRDDARRELRTMDLPQLFLRLLLHQAVQLFVVLDQRCREQTDVETQRVVVGAETHRATEKRSEERWVGKECISTYRTNKSQ